LRFHPRPAGFFHSLSLFPKKGWKDAVQFILGKRTYPLDAAALQLKREPYPQTWVDIGSGDGRFVLHAARANPGIFTIGVDACRENLVSASRRSPPNALFLIANALALPEELGGLAARLTIHFPWGSLLEGLLRADASLMQGLSAVACPGAQLDILLNAGALAEAGLDLDRGVHAVQGALAAAGLPVSRIQVMEAAYLRGYPSTWARRLAFGRDPRALWLSATRVV
jgi:hypothetical protein